MDSEHHFSKTGFDDESEDDGIGDVEPNNLMKLLFNLMQVNHRLGNQFQAITCRLQTEGVMFWYRTSVLVSQLHFPCCRSNLLNPFGNKVFGLIFLEKVLFLRAHGFRVDCQVGRWH